MATTFTTFLCIPPHSPSRKPRFELGRGAVIADIKALSTFACHNLHLSATGRAMSMAHQKLMAPGAKPRGEAPRGPTGGSDEGALRLHPGFGASAERTTAEADRRDGSARHAEGSETKSFMPPGVLGRGPARAASSVARGG
jgi:hypothetical protein